MTLESSLIFEHLDKKLPVEIYRFEIIAPDFMYLCHLLHRLHSILSQSDQQEEILTKERLRLFLSEWYTNPIPFQEICDVLEIFDEREILKNRWGEEVACLFDEIVKSAHILSKADSPMQKCIAEAMRKLKIHKKSFKVYCHKKSRPYFDRLFEMSPLEKERVYLHTLKDYKVSEIHDTLIKVGPLRSFGWGSVPDAILSAPHYSTMLHFIWSGSRDEDSFGFDPIAAETNNQEQILLSSFWRYQPPIFYPGKISSEKNVTEEVDEFVDNSLVSEEISRIIFPAKDGRRRAAFLLELSQGFAYLSVQNGAVLSFDPSTKYNAFARRKPGEDLTEEMYFILFQGNMEIDLGELQALEGEYSRKWKKYLEFLCTSRKNELIKKLKSEGLRILNVESALSRWCLPSSSVIPAPQTEHNFYILLSALNNMFVESHETGKSIFDTAWIHRAWNEVRRSRGEAISHGRAEQEIYEEHQIELLKNNLQLVEEQRQENQYFFTIHTKTSTTTNAGFSFHKIESISSGFFLPDGENIKRVDLEESELWRE